jgi:hypothetical protein
MLIIILMTVWLAALAALAVRIAIVRREHTGPERTGSDSWERSPRLLDAERNSLRHAVSEALEITPVVSSSEPAAAEHVGDGTQEDLYVGP